MKKWVLLVGFDNKKLADVKSVYTDYNLSVYSVQDMSEAIEVLAAGNDYLLVVIFMYAADDLSHVQAIRTMTNAPVIVVRDVYIKSEKVAVIEAGADEYIQWPETLQEFIASCSALLRRYTVLNGRHSEAGSMVLQGGVFIHKDYRKVFICGMEMSFTSREFEVFSLLAANPGRVFTYSQLFETIGDDGQEGVENSIHSCIRRIRRKLETISECPCSIENVRNVGYCFRLNKL